MPSSKSAVRLKILNKEDAANCNAEVRRYMALPRHPHFLKPLEIGLSKGLPDVGPFTKRLCQPPMVGLVFARYDTDLRQFLKKTPL